MRFRNAVKVLLAVGALIVCSWAHAQSRFVEGTDYYLIKQPQPVITGANVEVREIFSYACLHCARFEPTINLWKSKKPKNATLVLMPAIFNESWGAYARAFFTAENLKILDKSHGALFKAIYDEKVPFNSLDDLAKWFGSKGFGITAKQFSDAFVQNGLEAKLQMVVDRVPLYEVEGTPSVIVDGKYRVNMAAAPDAFVEVVNFLIAKAAAERPATKK